MLLSIRDRAKGWFAYLIVGLIAIPFAFWGVYEYQGGGEEEVAAIVNDREITRQELQRAVYLQRERLRQMFGGRSLPAFLDDDMLRKQVLDQLVRDTVVFESALRFGYGVSDTQVAETISAMQAFQDEGRFDNNLYERRLQLQGLTPSGFETQVREGIVSAQLSSGILDTGFVTTVELEELGRLERQEREFVYLQVPVSQDEAAVEVSEQQIADYYDANSDQFVRPETVEVSYLELRASELGRDEVATEDELMAMYDERKEQLTTEEERRARHILIQVDPEAEETSISAAREEAVSLAQRIREGESFSDLAMQASDDPGSAEQGGDLGFFSPGVMVPEFDEVAFSLGTEEISDPVRTEFGFHIIEVTEVRPGGTKAFEAVRADLEEAYRARVAEQQFYDFSEDLANLTYEQPDTLEAAADALNLEIKRSEPFSRNDGKGIAANPKIRDVAFSPDVLLEGNNSEVIEVEADHLVVVRVEERTPERIPPVEEVAEQIRERLVRDAQRSVARERGEALRAALSDLESFRNVAEEEGLVLQEPGFVRRDESKIDNLVRNTVFSMAAPEGDRGLRVADVQLSDGSYVLVGLTEVRDGTVEEDEAQASRRRGTLQNAAAQSEWKGFLSSLKASVRIN